MLARLTRHVRGNGVAYLALFVALGGTSYAAATLPANSVKSAQIAANAVGTSEVADGSLLPGDLSPATRVLPGSLRSGEVLTGTYAVSGQAFVARQKASAAVSFPIQVPSAKGAAFIGKGQPTIPECPGSATDPKAATPGVLCFYEGDVFDRVDPVSVAVTGFGGFIRVTADNPGAFLSQGTWAIRG